MSAPRVTLDQWRALLAVVDEGGFAQAAAALHRSQSSVSYAVARVEEHLGVAVLHTEGRRAVLTQAGAAVLRRARQLLADADALESMARAFDQGWEAEVQLVVDAIFPTTTLIDVLREFAPLSRGTRIQLREVVLSGADDALTSGHADLVIGYHVPPGFLGDPIAEIEFVAVAHPDHPLHRRGEVLDLDDLRRELQLVVRDSGAADVDSGWLGAWHRWTVTSMETSLTTISSGIGFAWLPRHRIADKLAAGQIKPLPLRAGQVRRGLLYMIMGKPNVGPATAQLADIFRRLSPARHLPQREDGAGLSV